LFKTAVAFVVRKISYTNTRCDLEVPRLVQYINLVLGLVYVSVLSTVVRHICSSASPTAGNVSGIAVS
jgi:hypothetical protein